MNDIFTNIRHTLGNLSSIALILAASAATSSSQAMGTNGQLRLQGEVIRTELEKAGQSQIYHLKLKLRFENTGEKPLILLLGTYGDRKDWWVLDVFLSHSLQDALNGKPFSGRPVGPANSQSLPMWVEMRKQLNIGSPPPAFTHIIQPHEIFLRDIETFVIIRDGDNLAPGSKIWLQLALEMWPSSIDAAQLGSKSLGDSLRRKWQSFGNLQLEPVLSSPVPFDMPVAP